MARIWKERFDPEKHVDQMDQANHLHLAVLAENNLSEAWVYFVYVCNFTFIFFTLDQAQTCLDYFSEKIHPSTRRDIGGGDHWEFQRWYERLPQPLKSERKRHTVCKAIRRLLESEGNVGVGGQA